MATLLKGLRLYKLEPVATLATHGLAPVQPHPVD